MVEPTLEQYEESMREEAKVNITNNVTIIAQAVKDIALLYDIVSTYSGITLLVTEFILDPGDSGFNKFDVLPATTKSSLEAEGKIFTYCTGLDICRIYKENIDSVIASKKKALEEYALVDYMNTKELTG